MLSPLTTNLVLFSQTSNNKEAPNFDVRGFNYWFLYCQIKLCIKFWIIRPGA